MSSVSAISNQSSCLHQTLCLPYTIVSAPVRFLANKVHELICKILEKIFGFFLFPIVFQLGVYNYSWLMSQVLEVYKGGLFDSRSRSKFDPERLEKTRDVFRAFGYVHDFERVKPKDGLVEIEFCHIRYQDVKESIENHGGKWIEIPIQKVGDLYRKVQSSDQSIEVILCDESKTSKEWKIFSNNVVSRMGWEEIALEIDGKTVKGFLTAEWEKSQARPKDGQCFIRSHSPSSSWAMEYKAWIPQHLSLHADLFVYDYRGTYKSTGIPSEGGYYLDVEAIYEIAKARGYEDRNIWSSGFCLGGAIAASLLPKYPINLAIENSYNSMHGLVGNYTWPGNILGSYAIPALRASEKEIIDNTVQDDFNSVEKLTNLNHAGASFIITNTIPDRIVPPGAHEQLVNAVRGKGDVTPSVYRPKDENNAHSADPHEDKDIWRKYVDAIARRNPAPGKLSEELSPTPRKPVHKKAPGSNPLPTYRVVNGRFVEVA